MKPRNPIIAICYAFDGTLSPGNMQEYGFLPGLGDMYDNNDVAKWPVVAVNYTTKTQFLFRINKGIADDSDNKKINKFIPEHKRRIPFSHIIYIGDGETDVPCMKLVKDKGGHSIAVYDPLKPDKQSENVKLLKDKRVNYVAPANYSKGKRLDLLVSAILDKILADRNLCRLEAQVEECNNGNLDAEISTPGFPAPATTR
jgi:hypothetical protein